MRGTFLVHFKWIVAMSIEYSLKTIILQFWVFISFLKKLYGYSFNLFRNSDSGAQEEESILVTEMFYWTRKATHSTTCILKILYTIYSDCILKALFIGLSSFFWKLSVLRNTHRYHGAVKSLASVGVNGSADLPRKCQKFCTDPHWRLRMGDFPGL